MKKMAVAITSAFPLNVFLRPHLERLQHDFEITVYVNTTDMGVVPAVPDAVKVVHLPICREISPFADLGTLWRLWTILRRESYDVLFSMNPKSGLLGMMAACAARVPRRVHCFTGQVWATKQGPMRCLLKAMDWLIASCATSLLTDSLSQREFLIANKIVKTEKIEVLGFGSVVGVDTIRFAPNNAARKQGRLELGIGASDIVFIFVGRLNRDKGITDLLQAFQQMADYHPDVHLLLVGPDENNYDAYVANLNGTLRQKIHRVGYTSRPELYMASSDVVCLPSYREGFGSVLIEAAAVALPAVASRIYGITDAVVDGETGILHDPGNIHEIGLAMAKLAEDMQLRQRMGAAAKARAIEDFSQERLTTALHAYFRGIGAI